MNIKIKRALFAILIIVNCMVIFSFSAQNSEKSSETSGIIVDKLVDTFFSVDENGEKESIRDTLTFCIRKTAHFSIYALLGIWLMNEANTFDISNRRKIFISVIFGLLYALSDEFHQNFVSGRSPEIRDVCIDTCGVLFGTIVVIMINKIVYKIRSSGKLPEPKETIKEL